MISLIIYNSITSKIYVSYVYHDLLFVDRYILVAPCFKNLLRLEAGYPALRCHNLKQSTGHTHTTHTTKTKTKTTQNSKTAKHSRRRVNPTELEQQGQRDEAVPAQPPAAAGGPAARAAPAAVR